MISYIGDDAFYDCGLTSLVLGPNLTHMGERAFAENPISYLVLPNAPKSRSLPILEGTFQGCPLEEIHISSSVNSIDGYAFDISGSRAIDTVDIYFNGTLSKITISKNAFIGNGYATVNVHANSVSAAKVADLTTKEYFINVNVVYHKEAFTDIILLAEPNGSPTVTNMTAIYGGKVVLPLVEVGDRMALHSFATVDNKSNYLSIFASDAEFAAGNVARSGDAVPIYPLSDNDYMRFIGSDSTSKFIDEMDIKTYSSGAEVDLPIQESIHYGQSVRIPMFTDATLNVNTLMISRADGTSYTMDVSLMSFRAGHYITTISIMSENMKIDVTFVRDGVPYDAEVDLQSKFEVPSELKYLENPPAGYMFGGWWTAEGGMGFRADENTKFSINQTWYAYFEPLEFTITVESLRPSYSHSVTVVGPFTLHVVNGSLYYTDLNYATNTLIFDARSIPGYSVNSYLDNNNMKPITGDYGVNTSNMVVDLYLTENRYELELRFFYDGGYISSEEMFSIYGWDIGVGTQFNTGSTIGDIPYNMIENGLIMPIPLHDVYAFSSMNSDAGAVPYRNGNYVLTLDSFDGDMSTIVTYVMQKDTYTVRFAIGDDTNASYNNYDSISVGQTFMMPSVDLRYFKTGFTFSHFVVPGSNGEYAERQSVTLTQEMAEAAEFCMVTVSAVWSPLTYNIGFDLGAYDHEIQSLEGIIVGTEITLPQVSGYSGYRVSGWHWILILPRYGPAHAAGVDRLC